MNVQSDNVIDISRTRTTVCPFSAIYFDAERSRDNEFHKVWL